MTDSRANVGAANTDEPAGSRWVPWAGLWIGLALAFYPALASGFAEVQLRLGDPRLVHYILEHSWQWLSGNPLHAEFWNPPVYWPATNGSALSDVMLGAGPLYWLARAAGAGSGVAMQLWMMGAFALNYLAAYLLLRCAARTGRVPSTIGALLFGFGSARLANFNSPQLFALHWGILALVSLVLALRSVERGDEPRRVRLWTVAAAGAAVLQVWSAFYPAFFLAASTGMAGLVALALPGTRGPLLTLGRKHPLLVGASLLGAALAVWPLAQAHLAVADQTGLRPWAEVQPGLPTWASWLYMGRSHLLYGGLSNLEAFTFQSAESQHSNGVGFLTTILALIGLLTTRRAGARLLLLTTLAMLVLSMRFGDFSLWRWVYEYVPGGGAVRYVARLGIYLALPAAFGVAWFLERPLFRGRVALLALVGTLLTAEQLHSLTGRSDAEYRTAVERIAARVDPDADAFFVTTVDPTGGAGASERGGLFARQVRARQAHILMMWVATEAGVPTVNGFYGLDPAGWRMVDPHVRSSDQERRLQALLLRWLEQSGVEPRAVQLLNVPTDDLPWGR